MESGLRKFCPKKLERDSFHVIHKIPSGDSPYVRAKYAQLVEKDPESAVLWFWKAINAGDRVESAVKDMAVVMKQLDRTQEAIEAVKSFRRLCPKHAQESLDNVLFDLYKKCGKVDEQIVLLKHKLKKIYLGEAFNGKPTKTARSHGKKFQVSVTHETSRILGNLGWAYMQKSNFMAAEVVYRKAQMIDPDANKALNLCQCLMKQARYNEARSVLQDVLHCKFQGCDDPRSIKRAHDLSKELEAHLLKSPYISDDHIPGLNFEDDFMEALERVLNEWSPNRSKRLPIFEEISQHRDQLALC
ncbi:Protein SULFUR DEFICIENCY-INDUCED 1 [Striga hermonthica]|uniref:Protein SULFUR DEFICIENCY-INDUCED 1 n=1 Tax=Striga hermonthica TaxID=68872 RepID=A0A9N7NAR1_STRHE|nr:Protein SULFUR DEFICIENCY-INDUCED 1 [Striga hermonthica]